MNLGPGSAPTVVAARPAAGAADERWWLLAALALFVGALHLWLLALQSGLDLSPQVQAAASDPQRALTAACAAWWFALVARGLLRRRTLVPTSRGAAVVLTGSALALSAMGVLSSGPGVPWCSTMALVTLPLVSGLTGHPPLVRLVLPISAAGAAVATFDAVGGRAGTVFGAFAAVSTVVAVLVPTVVVARLEGRLRAATEAALHQAETDPLTGLLNRRGLDERARHLVARPSRVPGEPDPDRPCVVVMDVDRFKAVNDEFGHGAGDLVLRAVADVLRQHVRAEDLLVRHGGEEFAWVGLWPDAASAVRSAERVRAAVAAAPMPHGRPVTLSAGVAAGSAGGAAAGRDDGAGVPVQAVHRLVTRADVALYTAKATGRNRVVLAPEPPVGEAAAVSAGAAAP